MLTSKQLPAFTDAIRAHWRDEQPLDDEMMVQALRVFIWFIPGFDFEDVRKACEHIRPFLEAHRSELHFAGLPLLVQAYLDDGDLDCSDYVSITNNVQTMVRADCLSIPRILGDKVGDALPLIEDLAAKFEQLQDARELVLYYIGDHFEYHLDALAIAGTFDPSDKRDIISSVVMNIDRCKTEVVRQWILDAQEWDDLPEDSLDEMAAALEEWDAVD